MSGGSVHLTMSGGSVQLSVVSPAAAQLVANAKEAGFTAFVMIRHANAAPLPSSSPGRADAPHDWKLEDQRRPITQRGQAQCQAAASSWFAKLPVSLFLSSPARRATETAMGMGIKPNGATLPLLMVEALHPAGQEEMCETIKLNERSETT